MVSDVLQASAPPSVSPVAPSFQQNTSPTAPVSLPQKDSVSLSPQATRLASMDKNVAGSLKDLNASGIVQGLLSPEASPVRMGTSESYARSSDPSFAGFEPGAITSNFSGVTEKGTRFSLSYSESERQFNMTFTKTDGTVDSFIFNRASVFRELDDGTIVTSGIRAKDEDNDPKNDGYLIGSDSQDIFVNVGNKYTKAHTIEGRGGNDIILNVGSAIGTKIDGGDGDDQIYTDSLSYAHINGDEGNDTIRTNSLMNTNINGNGGNDTITTGDNISESSVSGGDGDDILELKGNLVSASTYTGGAGNDLILSKEKILFYGSKVDGGDGDDRFLFTGAVDALGTAFLGGAGNDSIIMKTKVLSLIDSTIDGGDGDDTIYAVGDYTYILDSQLEGGKGNDAIIAGFITGNTSIRGGEGNDLLIALMADKGTTVGGGSGDIVFSAPNMGTGLSMGQVTEIVSGIAKLHDSNNAFADLLETLQKNRHSDVLVQELKKFSGRLNEELKKQSGIQVNKQV